jgi:hypothetical protein
MRDICRSAPSSRFSEDLRVHDCVVTELWSYSDSQLCLASHIILIPPLQEHPLKKNHKIYFILFVPFSWIYKPNGSAFQLLSENYVDKEFYEEIATENERAFYDEESTTGNTRQHIAIRATPDPALLIAQTRALLQAFPV